MRFSAGTLAALVAVPVAVTSAQNVIKVTVGEGGKLAYNPSNITAQVGDQIAFEFQSKNHTVTQSTFADPCIPATFNGSAGADSGFMFIDPNGDFSNGHPTWTITVNTDQPLWFHCAQNTPANHCKAGMVFSVNASPDKTFQAYLDKAKAFDVSTLPQAQAPPPSDNSGSQPAPTSADPSSASASDGSSAPVPPPAASAPQAASPPPPSAGAPSTASAPPVPIASPSNPSADTSASNSNNNSTGSSAIKNAAAARMGVSVRGLSGVVGAIVLGAVLI
jgi:plastocyanin